jgi:hypothetical protein
LTANHLNHPNSQKHRFMHLVFEERTCKAQNSPATTLMTSS